MQCMNIIVNKSCESAKTALGNMCNPFPYMLNQVNKPVPESV
jgi:hypothetical protein